MKVWIFIALFFLIIALIATINYKLNGSFKIDTAWLALGLAPVVIWLITAGQLAEFSGFGLAFKLNEAKAEALSLKTDGNLIKPEKISSDEKEGYSKIQSFKKNHTEALTIRVGKKGYYVNRVIEQYLEELTPMSFFKYVLFVGESGEFKGIMKANKLHEIMQERQVNVVELIENGEILSLDGVSRIAITVGESKQKSLQLMEASGMSELPVVNDSNVFVGVVERNKVTSSIVAKLVASTNK